MPGEVDPVGPGVAVNVGQRGEFGRGHGGSLGELDAASSEAPGAWGRRGTNHDEPPTRYRADGHGSRQCVEAGVVEVAVRSPPSYDQRCRAASTLTISRTKPDEAVGLGITGQFVGDDGELLFELLPELYGEPRP